MDQRCHPFIFGHYASSAQCIVRVILSCLLAFLCNPYNYPLCNLRILFLLVLYISLQGKELHVIAIAQIEKEAMVFEHKCKQMQEWKKKHLTALADHDNIKKVREMSERYVSNIFL